jgi:hypothetical protein
MIVPYIIAIAAIGPYTLYPLATRVGIAKRGIPTSKIKDTNKYLSVVWFIVFTVSILHFLMSNIRHAILFPEPDKISNFLSLSIYP